MTKTYYVGLDVHKETIAIAYATGGTREDSVYHGPCGGSVLAAERALRKLAEKLGVELTALTTQAQRPGPRGRWIATWTRWPGSLQRMVPDSFNNR